MKVVQHSAANNYKHYLKVQIEELSSEIGLGSPHAMLTQCDQRTFCTTRSKTRPKKDGTTTSAIRSNVGNSEQPNSSGKSTVRFSALAAFDSSDQVIR
jgi:hypothetical protein